MRSGAMKHALLLLLVPALTAAAPPIPESSHYQLVLSRKSLSAGERIEIGLIPPVPPGVRVSWREAMGTARSAIYRAPFVIPPGTPPVAVTAVISGPGVRTSAVTLITLVPGSVAGAGDCLGPGQSYSTTSGTIVPEYRPPNEIPELIHSVAPEYPKSALTRGTTETILLNALVCRSGHVLDAYPMLLRRGDNGNLDSVQQDPNVVEAALAAVRQYVFKPALVNGAPIAIWVTVSVRVGP